MIENKDNIDKQRLTWEKYVAGRKPLFYMIKLKKDEKHRKDKLDSSLLAFVLEGEVRMSTGIYVKDFVSEGQMFIVNKGGRQLHKMPEGYRYVFLPFRQFYGPVQWTLAQQCLCR